jgi:hypothetical protein
MKDAGTVMPRVVAIARVRAGCSIQHIADLVRLHACTAAPGTNFTHAPHLLSTGRGDTSLSVVEYLGLHYCLQSLVPSFVWYVIHVVSCLSSCLTFCRPGAWFADIDMIWFHNLRKLPSNSGHAFCSTSASRSNMMGELSTTDPCFLKVLTDVHCFSTHVGFDWMLVSFTRSHATPAQHARAAKTPLSSGRCTFWTILATRLGCHRHYTSLSLRS